MRVFISYRRGDAGTAACASLMHDRLERHFGDGCVFLDRSELESGQDFPFAIERALRRSKAVLVLIDPRWTDTLARLHEPQDWVRREIEIALARRADGEVLVIPVLLEGARMPAADQLPPSIAALADVQAQTLRGDDLQGGLMALVHRIEGWTPERLLLWLKARRQATLAVAAGLTLLACASATALLDALTLDTRLEAATMAMADWFDPPLLDARVLTVVIDRETERRLGRPFDRSWRAEHAALVRRLADGGAAAVAFDIALVGRSEHDRALGAAAEAARAAGTRVIFGLARSGEAPVLATPAIQWGLMCVGDELDWSRLTPLAARPPQAPAQGLPVSLALLAVHGGVRWHEIDAPQRVLHGTPAAGGAPVRVPFTRSERVVGEQACAALAPGDVVAQQLVRYSPLAQLRGPAHRVRYEDLCCGPPPPRGARPWQGRVVIVGSELESHDLREVAHGWGSEARWGYEIHADAAGTLLAGGGVRPLQPLAQFLVMAAMAALGLAVRFWRRLWTPWRLRAMLAGVPLVYLALATLAVAGSELLLNAAYHLGAFAFAVWVSGRLLRQHGLLREEAA